MPAAINRLVEQVSLELFDAQLHKVLVRFLIKKALGSGAGSLHMSSFPASPNVQL